MSVLDRTYPDMADLLATQLAHQWVRAVICGEVEHDPRPVAKSCRITWCRTGDPVNPVKAVRQSWRRRSADVDTITAASCRAAWRQMVAAGWVADDAEAYRAWRDHCGPRPMSAPRSPELRSADY